MVHGCGLWFLTNCWLLQTTIIVLLLFISSWAGKTSWKKTMSDVKSFSFLQDIIMGILVYLVDKNIRNWSVVSIVNYEVNLQCTCNYFCLETCITLKIVWYSQFSLKIINVIDCFQDNFIIIFTVINVICFKTLYVNVVEITLLRCYAEFLIHLLVRANRGVLWMLKIIAFSYNSSGK